MSITSRLFHKAVKVLRGTAAKAARRRKDGGAVTEHPIFDQALSLAPQFEPIEPRLLMSTVTIEAIGDATEGAADGSFRITRDDTLGDLTVKFTAKGVAKLGAAKDYTLTDGVNNLTNSVVIPDGVAFVDITVVAVDDALVEPTENIILTLAKSGDYDLDVNFTLHSATIDLFDDEPLVVVAAADDEADEDGDTATFTITRDGDLVGDLTVHFKLSGDAKLGKDYGLTVDGIPLDSKSVVIPDGQASVDVVVVPIDDQVVESTKSMTLELKTDRAYRLDPDFNLRSDEVTIADNEPDVTISVPDPVSAESGTPATDTATFTVSRTGDTALDLAVKFRRSGSARFGVDYLLTVDGVLLTSTTVVIPAGDASVDIVVVPLDDRIYEPTESVELTLLKNRAYTLGDEFVASATITENEPLIFIDPTAAAPESDSITTADGNIGADSYIQDGFESDDPHDNEPLQVRNATGVLNADSRKAYVSFDLAALSFVDYSNAILTLTLIDTEGFSKPNTNWKFNVFALVEAFSPNTGEQGEDWNEGITYEDAPINVSNGGQVETDTSRENAFLKGPIGSFSIVGEGVIGQTVSVSGQLLADYLNTEDDGSDGNQYVTFIIVRENIGDSSVEDIVHMFDSKDDGVGTIDTMPTLTVFGQSEALVVAEDDDAKFIRIFRAGNTVGDTTVNFSLSGTAKYGIDYTLEVDGVEVKNSFVIPDGEDFIDIDFLPINDTLFELDETIIITLRGDNSFLLDGNNKTLKVILQDDEGVVTIEANDDEGREPDFGSAGLDSASFTLTRTGSTAADLQVNVAFKGTALNGKDFVKIDKVVTIPAGSATIDVDINPLTDNIPEGAEFVEMIVLPGNDYGLNWDVRGTRSTTGSPIITTVAAKTLSDARKVAKTLGISGPRISPEDQSDTVTILTGNPEDGPDLTGLFFTLTKRELDTGIAAGSLGSFTLRNQGNQAVGPFTVRFVLSTDRNFDGGDFILSTQTVQSLGKLSNIVLSISVDSLAGLAVGRYFVAAQVDFDGFVLETVENNNTLVSSANEILVIA